MISRSHQMMHQVRANETKTACHDQSRHETAYYPERDLGVGDDPRWSVGYPRGPLNTTGNQHVSPRATLLSQTLAPTLRPCYLSSTSSAHLLT